MVAVGASVPLDPATGPAIKAASANIPNAFLPKRQTGQQATDQHEAVWLRAARKAMPNWRPGCTLGASNRPTGQTRLNAHRQAGAAIHHTVTAPLDP